MVSVNRITSLNLGKTQEVKNNSKSNVVQLKANDPNLLTNFMSLVASQNRSMISFGKALPPVPMDIKPVNLNGVETWLACGSMDKIRTESTRRINGEFQWPKIDKIDSWMISAETEYFMFVGGLAKVAVDLPNSMNGSERHAGEKMTVVTPMYLKDGALKLEPTQNGKFLYKSEKYEIEVEKLKTINVPVFDPWKSGRVLEAKVDVFKGSLPSDPNDKKSPKTDYILLHTPDSVDGGYNPNYFNINPAKDNNPDAKGCYAKSTSNIDELTRFAFFSKSVYELMKEAKEGNVQNLSAPNVAILNDWHAGPVASMMHYLAPVEHQYGRINNEMNDYFENMPTVSIVHNLEHQGATNDGDRKTRVTSTLFGAFASDIIQNAWGWPDADASDKNALFKGDAFNSAKNGLSLVDRVIPVSENYGEELIHSQEKANQLMNIIKARKFAPNPTLTPITNGYSKKTIMPNQVHMDKLYNEIKRDFNTANNVKFTDKELNISPLLSFEDGNLDNKLKNKNIVMDVLKQIVEREREIQGKPFDSLSKAESERKYIIERPFDTKLPDISDFANTPLMIFCGRVDKQKGLDYILRDSLRKLSMDLNYYPESKPLPVIVLGGPTSSKDSYEKLKQLKQEVMDVNPRLGKQIVIINGFVSTNLLSSAADMFFVPSVFEPCGLTQIEAMAKGALPIVTATGGLVNTVRDEVDGFVTKEFYDQRDGHTMGRIYPEPDGDKYSARRFNTEMSTDKEMGACANALAYEEAIHRALNMFYENPAEFKKMQKTALENDFSWDKPDGPLDKYVNLLKTGKIAG